MRDWQDWDIYPVNSIQLGGELQYRIAKPWMMNTSSDRMTGIDLLRIVCADHRHHNFNCMMDRGKGYLLKLPSWDPADKLVFNTYKPPTITVPDIWKKWPV